MEALAESVAIFGFAFGGWEIVLIGAGVLILLGAKKLPELARGLGFGIREFRKAMDDVDEEAGDAGKSLGGIYGKPAAEALTPENKTAELYDPAALREKAEPDKSTRKSGALDWRRVCRRIWDFISNLVARKKH